MQNKHYLKSELDSLISSDPEIFRFIQETALDGMWYWDLEKPEIEWMDTKFWELFGYDPSTKKHLASEWQGMIFQEDLEVALANFNLHLKDPDHPYDQVVRYKHSDGSTVWVRCRGLAIRDQDGNPIRMLGAHNDYTEIMTSKAAVEEALKGLERNNQQITTLLNRYSQLYDNMKDAFVVTDLNGVIQEGNSAFVKISGYRVSSQLSLNLFDLLDSPKDFYLSIIERQSANYEAENWLESKLDTGYGHSTPVQISLHLIDYPEENLKKIWAFIIDLTDKKKQENQKQADEQLLMHSAKLASMGEMVSAIAHQWRQPLNVVSGVLANIQDAYDSRTLTRGYLNDAILMADSNLQYMSRTINDFRDYLKPQKETDSFSLQDAFDSIERIVSAQLKHSNIDLEIAPCVSGERLKGSRGELEQVIVSLVSNSRQAIINKYSDSYVQEGLISLSSTKTQVGLKISISDNGEGIEEEIINRIFEPYFTTNSEENSSGIGLYIAKTIIENRFDSDLSVVKTGGEGTVFEISIPITMMEHASGTW